MTAAQIFNTALYRTRSPGVNWGGIPNPAGGAYTPLAALYALVNQGYGELLARSVDYLAQCAIPCSFVTANAGTPAALSIPLSPIPAGAGVNPSALKVLEMKYTQAGGNTYYVPQYSSARFRAATGAYLNVAQYGAFPYFASQQFGQKALAIWQGFAVDGDTVTLTVIPDVTDANNVATAANGGPIALPTDVPLGPSAFHMALVEYLVYQIAQGQENLGNIAQAALAAWNEYIEAMGEFGSAFGEGDPEQGTEDPWVSAWLMTRDL